MAKKSLTTNQVLFDTIRDLRKLSIKTGVAVWGAVADKLSTSASQRSQVNVSKIEKFANEGDVVIVPGKLLGDGVISKKVTVVAFSASESAVEKITAAKGKFVEIRDFIAKKPESKIKILG